MKSRNLAAHWKETTIQTSTASYQVLELVHNLFKNLSTTACDINQSILLPTRINLHTTNPYFLISPTT